MSKITRLMKDLNDALALQWSIIIQYLQHAAALSRPDSLNIAELLRSHAQEEIENATKLGEKIVSLGGLPTDRIESIRVADTWREMVRQDLEGEQLAISDLRDIVDDYQDEIGLKELMDEIIATKQRQVERLGKLLAA